MGMYIGGTGTNNHIDDYEEGTWTPGASGFTMGYINAATYTKIGR